MLPGRRNILAAAFASLITCVCWPFRTDKADAKPTFKAKPHYPSARFCFNRREATRLVLDVAHLPTRSTVQARDFFRCIDVPLNPKSAIEIAKHGHPADPYIVPYRWTHLTRRIIFSWTRTADVAIFLDLDRIFELNHDEFAAWSFHVEYLFNTNNWFRSRCEENSRLKARYREARLRDPRTVSV